jgi:hypothetical protein
MKQTIRVEDFIEFANRMVNIENHVTYTSYPSFYTREYKEAMCDAMEKVLHMAGRYGGYYFNGSDNPPYDSPDYFNRTYLIKNK